jgi:hypothetical protein
MLRPGRGSDTSRGWGGWATRQAINLGKTRSVDRDAARVRNSGPVATGQGVFKAHRAPISHQPRFLKNSEDA